MKNLKIKMPIFEIDEINRPFIKYRFRKEVVYELLKICHNFNRFEL